MIHVKEVRFRIILPVGFSYNDYNFSEIDYEIQRQEKQMSALTKDTEILDIDDCDISDSDSEESRPVSSSTTHSNGKNRPPLTKAKSFQVETKRKEFKRTNTETSIKSEDLPSSDSDSDDDSLDGENHHNKDDEWSGDIVVSLISVIRSLDKGRTLVKSA